MRKSLSSFTVLALGAGLLAGCGQGDSKPSSNASETKPATGDKKIVLKLLQGKPEIADKTKQMLADYQAENPNVTIEPEITVDVQTRLKTLFAAGEAPDIFFVKGYTDMGLWRDRLVDLSDEPWMSKVLPTTLPGMTFDDKKYGFPISIEGYGFIYNKDLFAKAGIDKVPTTITELEQVNEKLKAAGIVSYSEAYKEWWTLGQHLLSLPFAYTPDPAGYAKQLNDGSAKIKDNPMIDGFFKVLDMTVKYGSGVESLGVSYDTEIANFATGKVAMIQQGVWALQPILKVNPDVNMGMFPIPLTDNAEDTRIPISVPNYYGVNKESKNVEEAKKFLNWIHENGQKYLVDSFQFVPAFSDLQATDQLGPLAADMNEYVKNDRIIPFAFFLWPAPGIQTQFVKPLQAYVGEQLNKEQALDEIQKIWTGAVKK
ncbi:ABC transporter substrate-binding protein [Cohnella terricola]|uniref:Extracellular solute-binding protein n=1 Tax=Cohnella terricola TaxID=1289167 RepID=A0A559J9X3_9BACL|nr:extracellular solute-binding protein [Cohnella terricola]TVX96690.1 extracellular solute-binding protein [Cohnella terricola]